MPFQNTKQALGFPGPHPAEKKEEGPGPSDAKAGPVDGTTTASPKDVIPGVETTGVPATGKDTGLGDNPNGNLPFGVTPHGAHLGATYGLGLGAPALGYLTGHKGMGLGAGLGAAAGGLGTPLLAKLLGGGDAAQSYAGLGGAGGGALLGGYLGNKLAPKRENEELEKTSYYRLGRCVARRVC